MNRDIVLSSREQEQIRTLLGPGKSISEWIGKAAEFLQNGKHFASALLESMPWLRDAAEIAGGTVPVVGAALQLTANWLEQTSPYELGAVACTLAYQEAVRETVGAVWTRAESYSQAVRLDGQTAARLRELQPAEGADLCSFTREGAFQHAFFRRADGALEHLMRGAGFSDEQCRQVLDGVRERFWEKLDRVLTDGKTADRFAPFRLWLDAGSGHQAAVRAALQLHAGYQRRQFYEEPLLGREPYALADVYVDLECGALTLNDIRGPRHERGSEDDPARPRCDPFSESHGGRHCLLRTVLEKIHDQALDEPIFIQGAAGTGKSSFTLRLCVELFKRGFHPLRVRLKKLGSTPLLQAINDALELEADERVMASPLQRPKDLSLDEIFSIPYGTRPDISRYVLILDGWDELDSYEKGFHDRLRDMLRQVRDFAASRRPRVRVIVTGRPSTELAESTFLRDETPVLTIRVFRPEQLRAFVVRVREAQRTSPLGDGRAPAPWNVPDDDELTKAFERYESGFRAPLPDHNRALPRERFGSVELLGLPLLAYLALRVMAQTLTTRSSLKAKQTVIDELIDKPTTLYRSLLDLITEKAGKSSLDPRDCHEDIGLQAREVGAKLRSGLQRLAAMMSMLGVRQLSREEWLHRTRKDAHRNHDQQLEADDDERWTRLLVSSLFKVSGPQQVCEFLHDSFRDYLFAESIVETLKRFGRRVARDPDARSPRKPWRDFAAEEDRARHELSRSLAEALGPRWLSADVWGHVFALLEWEIARASGDDTDAAPHDAQRGQWGLPTQALSLTGWRSVRDGLADLWEWWCDEAHLRAQFRRAQRRRSRSSEKLLGPAYVNQLAEEVTSRTRLERDGSRVEVEGAATLDAHLGDALCQIAAFVHTTVARREGFQSRDFSRVGEQQSAASAYQRCLQGERVRFVLFAPSGRDIMQFGRCIARVNAAKGRPFGPFPQSASLDGVVLSGVHLPYVGLIQTLLHGARLDGARLDGANLFNARLDGANLARSRFDGASLWRADLRESNLSGASFDFAHLSQASLDGANLDGASFRNARLTDSTVSFEQIASATIDDATELPEHIAHRRRP